MARPREIHLARTVVHEYGKTYAEEIGIQLRNAPAPLFMLLNAALLMSARIPAGNAVQAARALREAKYTTPQKMAAATWQDRVDVITWNGYKRYDERTATLLGDIAGLLMQRYHGDLRRMRDEAGRNPEEERRLLQQFKGIGGVGADIFLREVQGVWLEVYPYADDRVLRSARKLGLPGDPQALARMVARQDFPRFVAGLVRIDLGKAQREVEARAA